MAHDRSHRLQLVELAEEYSICRLPADATVPGWVDGEFLSITRTPDELSITCRAAVVPAGVPAESGWSCFKVAGPLDFSEIGIVAALANPLAAAGVGIFVVSTFDTDYLLVKSAARDLAINALQANGHSIAQTERTSP